MRCAMGCKIILTHYLVGPEDLGLALCPACWIKWQESAECGRGHLADFCRRMAAETLNGGKVPWVGPPAPLPEGIAALLHENTKAAMRAQAERVEQALAASAVEESQAVEP